MKADTGHAVPRSVAVAVSGGVDSLYALATLHAQGLAQCAVHARFLETDAGKDPVPGLRHQCAKLGIALHVVDLREAFRQRVIRPFVRAYAEGNTPNPCAWCNRRMKFGMLADAARALGAQGIATGHYAELVAHPVYGRALRRGTDRGKDQSYFLALVEPDRLTRAVFPLAGTSKAEARAAVEASGLDVPVPAESQEICFVPDDAYRPFLERQAAEFAEIRLPGAGDIRLADGRVVGRHKGLWQYTEGQRRGLGVAWEEPLYVIGKSRQDNALIVGPGTGLMTDGCTARDANIIVPQALWPEALYVQTRYRQKPVRASVLVSGQHVTVRFDEPQGPSAPGQILAIYDADGFVLGGAIIAQAPA